MNENICPSFAGARDLLSKFWRSEELSHHIGALKNKHFKNIPVNSIDDAIEKAQALNLSGHEVYFACAEYQTPENRKVENALGAHGYWFDIDCGPDKAADGKGYGTKQQANSALRDFLKVTKLPNPDFIVDSGNGLHVYFCSDEFIPKDQWKIGAQKLKALTRHYNLIVDPSRTTDLASVLRIPNTNNFKNPIKPKLVKIALPKGE